MAKSYSKLPLHASLVALGVAAGLASSPREAAAADPVRHTVSPGFMLSLSLGDKTAFGIGADVRYTAVFGLGGVGAFAQATVLPTSAGTAGRFAVGAHGGGALGSPLFALDGELGYMYRTAFDEAHPGGHGIHAGLASYWLILGEFTVRGTIPLSGTKPEVTLGLGARFPTPVPGHLRVARKAAPDRRGARAPTGVRLAKAKGRDKGAARRGDPRSARRRMARGCAGRGLFGPGLPRARR